MLKQFKLEKKKVLGRIPILSLNLILSAPVTSLKKELAVSLNKRTGWPGRPVFRPGGRPAARPAGQGKSPEIDEIPLNS